MSEADLTARVEALVGRLTTVEAAEATRNLKARYAELVDRRYRRGGGAWLHTRMKLSVVFMAPHDKGWAR